MRRTNGVLHSKTAMQLLYYGVSGIAINVLGYFIFLLMTHFNMAPKIAMTMIYLFCALGSYLSNWRLTFKGSGSFSSTSIRFLITHISGYSINLLLLLIFVDYLGYSYYEIQAIAIIIVAAYLFIVFKLFVFPSHSEKVNEKMPLLQ
ncbi:GtrA family protein [Legionella sainthelensi]|uniref:GtrA family protein n=1 Tax=Legionella sainthelensi TaxID=28087 RepID=UPI000E20C329|nr:GtrA family protein [Legionella sainthelensi]